MITKKLKLNLVNYFELQLSFPEISHWNKDEVKYVLDLIKRDWKMEGNMRKPYQVRNEMEHQKKLLKNLGAMASDWDKFRHTNRIHFASWVLGDSSTF